jgi:NADH-quinone oxidoreductase subunit C
MPVPLSEIHQKLQAHLGDSVELLVPGTGDASIVVPAAKWRDSMQFLRSIMGFAFLRALSGVDRPEAGQIEVVAHLFSYARRLGVTVRTRVDRASPTLDSVHDIWPAADWHERELFDMFGVQLIGHPDLRRLLLPDDWVGFPLRKDYHEPASYHGIPMTRPRPEAVAPSRAEKP